MLIKNIVKGFVLWAIFGFVIGIMIGLIWYVDYLHDYTNKCIEAYNECKEYVYKNNFYTGFKPVMEELTWLNESSQK